MSRERSLLERIALGEERARDPYARAKGEDLDALIESVRHHLIRLLNARHGMSEALPDYGIPALTDLVVGSRDYLTTVQEAIRITIEKYEPRLHRVRVSLVGDDEGSHARTLAFRVDAILKSQSGEHRVWYQTEVAGSGEFSVSE